MATRLHPAEDEQRLLCALREGDEHAFEVLVKRHTPGLLRLARTYVGSDAAAEDVVQDAWLGVLRGIEQFEGRCSLQTWLYRVLINRAKSSGVAGRRTLSIEAITDGPTVPAERFHPAGHERVGSWAEPPRPWHRDPETQAMTSELRQQLREAIDGLPDLQRQVVLLRDVEGFSARDTADLLQITEINQRTLLHRGRARLRAALDGYLSQPAAR